MSISNNDIIKCNFNNTLTITYSKIESNIINGRKVEYVTTEFQKIIESHFKNRPADKIQLNHNNTFNYVDNQYVQLLKTIKKAIIVRTRGALGMLFNMPKLMPRFQTITKLNIGKIST